MSNRPPSPLTSQEVHDELLYFYEGHLGSSERPSSLKLAERLHRLTLDFSDELWREGVGLEITSSHFGALSAFAFHTAMINTDSLKGTLLGGPRA